MTTTRVIRHQSALGQWELVTRRPDPLLSSYVREYEGYVETAAAGPICRREVAWPGFVLIINFGPPYRITDPRLPGARADYRSFVAGMYDSYVITESTGPSYCIQVNFTPIGANLFFGQSLWSIANRTVRFEDMVGPEAMILTERLYDTPTWEGRFALLDSFIATRIHRARPMSPRILWAWQQLQHPENSIRIGALAAELGWSPKHLVSRFRDQIGLPPSSVARILRFHRVVRLLEGADSVRWAELAYRAGYYDQAHFNHDFRDLAGTTPGDFLRRRVADGGGIIEQPR